MSIQSTVRVTRSHAVDRIRYVDALVASEEYREIDKISFEPEASVQLFVDGYTPPGRIRSVEKWTNEMLEEALNLPFFRHSMFDNYEVVDNGEGE